MPKLILKFEDRILREILVGQSPVTIGRLPNNTVAIDNPAVSGQHARVVVEGGQYILEDLNSRNGTFVNNQPINRHVLREGDVVGIGKHTLVFHTVGKGEAPAAEPGPASVPAAAVQDLGGTVYLDTKAQKELLAKAAAQTKAAAPVTAPKQGVLTILSGRTDQRQYTLEAQTTLVGKSSTAQIRLKGWFKPQVAAAITRKGTAYVLTPLAGKAQINNQPLKQSYELKPGDVVHISGVTLQFSAGE
ncbi:MAG TPA: FHA domain-containing protein [Candidatus Acidoferrales bacterium]|nr:FHA domain-containing protein [Candidatus Acidoferrales bacterium]